MTQKTQPQSLNDLGRVTRIPKNFGSLLGTSKPTDTVDLKGLEERYNMTSMSETPISQSDIMLSIQKRVKDLASKLLYF